MAEIIGLTGQTGAGKSSVRKMFKSLGAEVIDADEVAHSVADNELWCLVDIVEHFSCLVLNDRGKLNRKALGKIVFSDRKKLLTLNKIMFPYIVDAIKREADALERKGARSIVIDGATLIESGCAKMCDCIISVTADEETRTRRIIERDGLTKLEAQRRVSAQHPEDFYTEVSDFVIRNDGSLAELEQKVGIVAGEIAARRQPIILEEEF